MRRERLAFRLFLTGVSLGFFAGAGFRPPTWSLAAVGIVYLILVAIIDPPDRKATS